MTVAASVEFTGPLFDGSLDEALDKASDDVGVELAAEAANRVRDRLGQVLRHPTGRYQSSIGVVADSVGARVSDGGVIYGSWLEGTSSRNDRSRFKGYATFRRVAQELDGDVVALAEPIVERAVGRAR